MGGTEEPLKSVNIPTLSRPSHPRHLSDIFQYSHTHCLTRGLHVDGEQLPLDPIDYDPRIGSCSAH